VRGFAKSEILLTQEKTIMKKAKTRVVAERVARKVADATDTLLVKAGDSARKRLHSRKTTALRKVGKVALVLGAGAATAYAGRAVVNRVNGASGSRSRKS
jgi:hypothetical protein